MTTDDTDGRARFVGYDRRTDLWHRHGDLPVPAGGARFAVAAGVNRLDDPGPTTTFTGSAERGPVP